jgi:hypothetical protein
MTVKEMNLGESINILEPGRLMHRCGTQLPPGRMKMCLLDGRMIKDGDSGIQSSQQQE